MTEEKFSAAGYRKNVKTRRQEKSVKVKLPSNAEFFLKKPNVNVFLASGELPQSYIEKIMLMEGKPQAQVAEAVKTMSVAERVADLKFLGLIVRGSCVLPRIVENPQTDEEITFSDLDDDDMRFIAAWALSAAGGVGADEITAENFHSEE